MEQLVLSILVSNLIFLFINFIVFKKNWILFILVINSTYICVLHEMCVAKSSYSLLAFIFCLLLFSIEIIVILILNFLNKENKNL